LGVGLSVLTLIEPDWIEEFFRVEPDAGSGEAERLVAGVLIAVSVVLIGWAALEWRAPRPSPPPRPGRPPGTGAPPPPPRAPPPAGELRIPLYDARALLRQVAPEAAGVSANERQVVFTSTAGELLVELAGLDLACVPGLVTVTLTVACDQVPGAAAVRLPFGV